MTATFLTTLQKKVEARLSQLLAEKTPPLLWESMSYSVFAGGKRIRPALCLLGAQLMDVKEEEALDLACAIELIQTYSLIHDDLPALDNDTLRRGKPTNHVVFGEAQAILAGDGLLNYAYEVMLSNASQYPGNLKSHLAAISCIAKAAGVDGMIAGQVVDILKEGTAISKEELSYIHAKKTGAFLTGSLLTGALLSPAISKEEIAALSCYGQNIGLVFQIVDDILDITADASLGKTTGKDARDHKTTYASLYGIEEAKKLAASYTQAAKQALCCFSAEKTQNLLQLADMLLKRTM